MLAHVVITIASIGAILLSRWNVAYAVAFFVFVLLLHELYWRERARRGFHRTTIALQKLVIQCNREGRAPTMNEYNQAIGLPPITK